MLEALPKIRLFLDDFGADMEAVVRRMYLEPGKLPLAVIVNRSVNCIYGAAGYNVGTGTGNYRETVNQEKGICGKTICRI